MRSDSARRLIAALSALVAALVGAVVPAAQAAEQIVETALLTPGTPEPDGEPVMIDTTILTADPATAQPAIVLAHGFGGTKDDSLSHRPYARPRRLHGDHLHRSRVREVRRPDPPGQSGVRGRRCPEDHRPGRDPTGGDQGRRRSGDRLRRCLVRRGDHLAGRGPRSSGGCHRPGVHLEQPEPVAVPAAPGRRRAAVTGRRHPDRPARSLQAALGFAVVPQCRPAARRRQQPTRCAGASPPSSARATCGPRRRADRIGR